MPAPLDGDWSPPAASAGGGREPGRRHPLGGAGPCTASGSQRSACDVQTRQTHNQMAEPANVAAAALMPEATARQHIEQLKAKMAQLDQRRENLLKTKPSVRAHLPGCMSRRGRGAFACQRAQKKKGVWRLPRAAPGGALHLPIHGADRCSSPALLHRLSRLALARHARARLHPLPHASRRLPFFSGPRAQRHRGAAADPREAADHGEEYPDY